MLNLDEFQWKSRLIQIAAGREVESLVEKLFGPKRILYKRLAQLSEFETPELYRRVARKPFPWLVEFGSKIAGLLASKTRKKIQPMQVLVDAPPVGLEVQFEVEVCFEKQNVYRSMAEVSPMTETLARRQFDDVVKRVRVFVDPALELDLSNEEVDNILRETIEAD